MVCTFIDNDMHHHSGQNAVSNFWAAAEWIHSKTFISKTIANSLNIQKQHEKIVWEKNNGVYSLTIRVQTMKNHIMIFLYHNINVKENDLVKARAERGIGQHIYVSSVIWTLIDNGKLANQITRLTAIVVKSYVTSSFYCCSL